jgi:serine-type D-Ala-D-Ala carboxypeptidase
MKNLEQLLQQGVEQHIFPSARASVFHQGKEIFSGGNVSDDSLFDVASLTKVMCTTALVLERRIPLFSKVRHWMPFAPLEATIEDLLFHRSGLAAFSPFFADEINANPKLLDDDCSTAVRAEVRRKVLARVGSTAPERDVGKSAVYSDLGFILLGNILEADSKLSLEELFTTHVKDPLKLSAQFRRISSPKASIAPIIETGTQRPRPAAPGQEGQWYTLQRPSRIGEVDDDNCFVLDGVSGHAGLFATANDVSVFGNAILSGRIVSPLPWTRDTKLGTSTRALGFDTPSSEGASCGSRFGKFGALGAIGHLGFTGTSLWIDFDRQLVVSLLTNRVALGRENLKIREFRPLFHDAVLDAIGAV